MTAVLGWWAFAFLPLPSAPPAWLAAARVACFGAMERGLPDASGWMMLALAPAGLLAAILVIWSGDLASVLRAARSRAGLVIVTVFALAAVVEGGWVVDRLHAARTAEAWTPSPLDDGPLPAAYPRETRPAPDFTLLDQHGAALSLAGLGGRPVVVTFVFAHCQTMCPFIVATLKRAVPSGAAVLLVTLDPWRDTPSALPGIAARWELPDHFHVVSARSVPDVARVAAAYGVSSARDERTGDIVHPGLVFVIDADGRLAYTFSNPPADWVRDALARLGRARVRAG